MNFVDRIRAVIEAMATAVGTEENPVRIIRAYQSQKHPGYPHGLYTVMQGQGEEPHRHSISHAPKEGDATTVVRTRFETIRYDISLTFLGTKGPDELYELAEKARNWLISLAGQDVCTAQKLVARLNGGITDRSVFMEQVFEKRVGFDFRLDGDSEITEELPAINTVSLNGTTLTLPT